MADENDELKRAMHDLERANSDLAQENHQLRLALEQARAQPARLQQQQHLDPLDSILPPLSSQPHHRQVKGLLDRLTCRSTIHARSGRCMIRAAIRIVF